MKTTEILRFWLSVTVILGCSTGPTLAAESIALQDVKIGCTSTSISVFPIEFARRKGFLRDEGLNIVMIVMRTNVIMNALLTRGIDYGTPTTSIIRGAASDLPVKAVAVLTGRPDYFLAAKKELGLSRDLRANGSRSVLLARPPTSLFEWCCGKTG
jgi:ABC-type nitrate/sulfonate/bicarbonate transport system substrate-binding protein